jgi:hypothetical protein
MPLRAVATIVTMLGGLVLEPIAAQEPAPRQLPAATQESADGFSRITGLVELPDGRLLLSDGREIAVHLVDLARGKVTPAASKGRGPKEFAQPGGLYRMRNGEVLLLDQLQRRYLRFSRAGAPLGTTPFAAVGGMSFSASSSDPHLLDGDGAEYAREPLGRVARDGESTQSWLTRRTGERLDSLIRLRNAVTVVDESQGFRMVMRVGFAAADGFAVARDGAVAIVRAEPYRVEWRERNGRLVQGPAYAFDALPVTDADRAASAAARREVALPAGMRITRPDGSAIDPMSAMPEPRFAASKPAFFPDDVRIDPQDRVWVRRHTAHDAPLVYDVFDRRGVRVDRVQLPPRTTLAGFGATAIYLARADEDDLLWVGRVP